MMFGWGNMMGGYGPGGYFNSGYWWMGIIGMVVQVVFWIAIIAIVVGLFRRYGANTRSTAVGRNSALDILRERYARGELDTEEFNRRKADLM